MTELCEEPLFLRFEVYVEDKIFYISRFFYLFYHFIIIFI